MRITIQPGPAKGDVRPPASKSMMQRVCAGAVLHRGKTTIYNPGNAEDDRAAIRIAMSAGAEVNWLLDGNLEILSDGLNPVAKEIDCGESGLSARMFIPILALSKKTLTITGRGSLLRRPMHLLTDVLPGLNVRTKSNDGYLPLTIKGPMQPGNLVLDGSDSSQFLTGFLFAYAFGGHRAATIEVHNLKSRPYVDMTLQVLGLFRRRIVHEDYQMFTTEPVLFERRRDIEIEVEADWSSAAFWLVAGAIAGEIELLGLNQNSFQADRAIMKVLEAAGAHMNTTAESITVSATPHLKSFDYDATHTPDLFPVLAVLAANCKGTSRMAGLHRLAHKESNRVESICAMLTVFGTPFRIEGDSLLIEGGAPLKGGIIHSFQDHRIAMAAAVAALVADSPVAIENSSVVAKSYPAFFIDMASLGLKLKIEKSSV